MQKACEGEESYTREQEEEIRLGLEEGLDIGLYARPGYTARQMRVLRQGLEAGVSLIHLAGEGKSASEMQRDLFKRVAERAGVNAVDFYPDQLEEIRCGLHDGIPVACFADPSLSSRQMREIRLGLAHGVRLLDYVTAACPADIMRRVREALEAGKPMPEVT